MTKEACKNYRELHRERYYKNQTAKRNTFMGRVKDMHHNAKTRSKQKKLEFNITLEDVINMYFEQDGKCAITKLDLATESGTRKKANAFRISIDRIDSNGGYTLDNVRLVCWAVNQMKADRTEEEFIFWLKAISSQVLGN